MAVGKKATKEILVFLLSTVIVIHCSFFATAQKTILVGGAVMSPSKNIADNVVASKVHSTLIAAYKVTGLIETLKGAGPFTVFAPTDRAFNKLPKGAIDALLKPENKDNLAVIINYHIVPGVITSASLIKSIQENKGTFVTKTVAGGDLTFTMDKNIIIVKDEKGGVSHITIKDVNQSNGIVHVIDAILLPKG